MVIAHNRDSPVDSGFSEATQLAIRARAGHGSRSLRGSPQPAVGEDTSLASVRTYALEAMGGTVLQGNMGASIDVHQGAVMNHTREAAGHYNLPIAFPDAYLVTRSSV